MKGAVISSVCGDGDWVLSNNLVFSDKNKLKVNSDVTTYDADAINYTPSEADSYVNSAKELIKSQKTGYTVPLKEVINGKLTGKIINHKIDGCTTWDPSCKTVFDALSGYTKIVSTKEFNNQMADVIIVIKEWAEKHDKIVTNILKQSFVGANQMKLSDSWSVKASEAVASTYSFETPRYWYDMFKGYSGTKDGVEYSVGGSKVFNYSDCLQYFGLSDDAINRYKSVYDQVSTYLTELNPGDFNSTCKNGVIPYNQAVDLYFIKSINDIDAGTVEKANYSTNKTEVLASGNWAINFETGSANIKGSTKDLETIYNLLIQAENTKLNVVGFTDNTGNSDANILLSKGRAQSVVMYLENKGISGQRFQIVDGKGDTYPVGDNKTNEGKFKNRRVEITLLK